MNRLTSSLVALFMISSVSAKTSVNIGIGAVARKTSLILESKDKQISENKEDFKFKKNGNIGYFAGRVNVHAFYNMFGLRFSADVGNDKKQFTKENIDMNINGKDLKLNAKAIAKSNFTVRIAPAVQYNVDKFTVSASIGGIYKNAKLSVTIKELNSVNILEEGDDQNKHNFGFGGHVGINYHFNSRISAFVEASADFIMKKNSVLPHKGEDKKECLKFTSKSSIDFAGCVGVAAQIIG